MHRLAALPLRRQPFIAIRSLFNVDVSGEGENQMATFMSLASTNSAEVVKAVLGALPPQKES